MKTFFYTLLLSISTLCLNAQITFGDTDLPTAGDAFQFLTDTLTAGVITPGAAGASQTWNLPSLNVHNIFTTNYVDATTTPFSSDFPTANVALDIGGGNYVYYENTTTHSDIIGLGGDPTGTGFPLAFAFDDPQRDYQLPTNFGDNFTDTYSFTATIDGSAFQVDSIRITRTGTRNVNVDAWGMLTLPGSGPHDVLRTFVVDNYTDVIEAQTFGFWVPVQTTTTDEESYIFVSKESKGALVTMNMDIATGDVSSIDYANLSGVAVPEADFTFNDLGNGPVDFTDASFGGAATSWSWDFGDGNTSMMQNPSHTYAAPGSYTVCLTSTNAAGSTTACQIVDVVFAPTALFTFMNSATVDGGVDFTDASSNSPDTWLWDFGNGSTNTLQNPSHTFVASGTYNVCLTASNSAGSDMSCQNVTVVLSSIFNPLDEIGMEVFPNPVSDNMVLAINEAGDYQLMISDITGRLVFSRDNLDQGSHPMSLGHLPQGTYIIRLTDLENNKGKALKITIK